MEYKSIDIMYTDKRGKTVRLTQDGKTGSIAVFARAKKDIKRPFGEPIRKGDWFMEFHAMGDNECISNEKTAKHYDEQGLIDWYEENYCKLLTLIERITKKKEGD